MVGRDNVTFTFRIDSAKAQQTLKQLELQVKKLGGAMVRTGQESNRLQTNMGKTSDGMAASAINFQTATQGALNLSTAMVQTYTSISNLDRANNRAKQSVIAVARAEDLLNNKIQRRNEMQKAGISGGMKYANISREIATAEADLTVKIEKRGIEQAAVNDIYMLFATNIANVTISSMQTIAILDKNSVLLTKAKIVGQKLYNLSMFNGVRASLATQQATAIETAMRLNSANATKAQAGAMAKLTLATKTFMSSNPLLLAAMAASVAAFAIHESNIIGTKTALDELLGIEGDFQTEVDKSRNSVDGLTESMTGQKQALIQLPENYRLTIRELQNIRKEYGLVAESVENTNTQLNINKQLVGSGFRSGGVTPQITGINGYNSSLSNVVRTEGDQVFTARSLGSQAISYETPTQTARLSAAGVTTAYAPSVMSNNDISSWKIKLMKSAATGMLATYNPNILSQPKSHIVTADSGELYRKGSIYDTVDTLSSESKAIMDITISQIFDDFKKVNEFFAVNNINIELATSPDKFMSNIKTNFETQGNIISGLIRDVSPSEEWKIRSQQAIIKSQIQGGLRPSNLYEFVTPKPGAGKFVTGGGVISSSGDQYGVGALYGTAGVESAILSLEEARKTGPMVGESQTDFDLRMASYQIQIDVASSQPIRIAVQDLISKGTIRDMGGFGATPEEREKSVLEFFEREIDAQKKRLLN